tara:strand:+ start:9400 stop:11130 length:1731 start_codon:yes stop_codon:yes gene_type:complete
MFRSIKKIPKVLNKEQKIKLVINLFLSFFIPFLELLSIGSIASLVLFILDLESYKNLIPLIIKENFLINLDKRELLIFLSIMMLFAIIIKNVFLFGYHYFEFSLRKSVARYHANKLFNIFLNQSYLEHTFNESSVIQNDILNQAQKCSDLIYLLMIVIKDTLIAFILISSLFLINLKASILLVILSIFISIIFYFFSSKKMKDIGAISKKKESELIKIVRNTFDGFKLIILFGKKNFFENIFRETLFDKFKFEILQHIVQKIPRLIFEIFFAFIIILILINFAKNDGDIENILPFLIFLSLISMRLLPIAINLNTIIANVKYIQYPVEDLLKFLIENNSKIINIKNDKPVYDKLDYKDLETIEIKNITFSYNKDENKIFENASCSLKKGKIYAITGKTGVGKSTLLDILTGILIPSKGSIFINGKDIRENIIKWQENVGYVPQDHFLLNDSIAKNICFGEEKLNLNKIKFSIENSELSELLSQLPEKENTIVGDRGIRISGGQKQRLGLARALYNDKTFLAFDEATSAVDQETELNILNTLHKLKKDRIIVIIAHRENTIKSCDEEIKISDKKIFN